MKLENTLIFILEIERIKDKTTEGNLGKYLIKMKFQGTQSYRQRKHRLSCHIKLATCWHALSFDRILEDFEA